MTYTPSLPRLTCASALALILLASPAHAEGVPAGTLIENTANAKYNTGGPTQSLESNTVTIKVDELLDVAVASKDGSAVSISGSAVLSFSVTNTGNGPESFVLTADPNVAGNAFSTTVESLAIDTNANGVYDADVDTRIANGGQSPSVAPDTPLTVFVLVSSPGAADGATSQVNLLAQAATGTGAPGTVFSGAGEGGGAAVVGSTGADDETRGSLIASAVSVALVKTAAVRDPFGGSQPVPGARITFQIVASTSGTGSVSDLIVTDAIPTATTYAANSLSLDGSPLTDLSDGDSGTASGSGISVKLGTTTAGTSRTVKFDAIIN
jgi:uncharacterized repeat protein (TIGR01451 family)